ncbi:MAG: hypothetical protein ACRDZ8_18185 [Acidimicrobiales bacterium]
MDRRSLRAWVAGSSLGGVRRWSPQGRAGSSLGPARRARRSSPAVVLAAVLAASLLAACSRSSKTYSAKGFNPEFPSFLPKKTLSPKVDQVLVGTAAKPALSVQGESIEVTTPAWSVLVEVSGPVVPGEGLPLQQPATTCTWTVTMSKATAVVPVSLADFNTIDHLGTIYQPSAVEGQAPPPAEVDPGETATFQVRAYEAVGEGIMRWAPISRQIVAEWDFEVEND